MIKQGSLYFDCNQPHLQINDINAKFIKKLSDSPDQIIDSGLSKVHITTARLPSVPYKTQAF